MIIFLLGKREQAIWQFNRGAGPSKLSLDLVGEMLDLNQSDSQKLVEACGFYLDNEGKK
jgi:hypothetical protein